MLNEYDYVELTEDLDSTLRRGTRGAIVMVYPSSPQEYEVEFVDNEGETLAVRTVKESLLRRVAIENPTSTRRAGEPGQGLLGSSP
jgi:hypothetical protein